MLDFNEPMVEQVFGRPGNPSVDASPEATRLWQSIEPQVQTLIDAFPAIVQILHRRRTSVNTVDMDPELSDKGKVARKGQASNTAAQAIDSLMAKCQAAAKTIEDKLTVAEGSAPTLSAPDALVHEIQQQRAWARMVRILDNCQDENAVTGQMVEFMQQAAKSSDRVTADTLMAEAAWYYKGRANAENSAFFGRTDTLENTLRAAYAPFLPASARAAFVLEQQIRAGYNRLMNAFTMARDELGGSSTVFALPGWLRNTQFDMPAGNLGL